MNDIFVRQSVINALAGIGFIAVLGLGMLTAIYLARFVPQAVTGVATAVVSVTSVFFPAEENPGIVIIPTPENPGGTTPVGVATSTTATSTTPSVSTL